MSIVPQLPQLPQLRIVVEIPDHHKDDEAVHEFRAMTDEDRFTALCVGTECVRKSRAMVAETSNRDMYAEMERGFHDQLAALSAAKEAASRALEVEQALGARRALDHASHVDSEVDRAVRHKMDAHARGAAEKAADVQRLSDLLRARDQDLYGLREQLRTRDQDMRAQMGEEVRSKMAAERAARDGELVGALAKSAAVLEAVAAAQAAATAVRSSTEIGEIGERQFIDIAKKTFADFDGFDLEDVHGQPHKGDVHITIKGVTVLVDAKSYKRNVDASQIEKIKADLRRNEHIHFAWLVSLNTGIDRRDNATFLLEWISDEQCVVHINNLLAAENREMLLKTVFYLCRDHHARIQNGKTGHGEVVAIRDSNRRMIEGANGAKKRMKEMKSAVKTLATMIDAAMGDLVGMMNDETNSVVQKYYAIVLEWWGANVAPREGAHVKSAAAWSAFRRDNDSLCGEAQLDVAAFKDILCLIVPDAHISRGKGRASGIDIREFELSASAPASAPVPKAEIVIDTAKKESERL